MNSLLRPILLISFTVFFVLFSLFIYTKTAGPIPFSINSVSTQKTDSFSVTGEGRAKIKPDKATVRLGVTADGPTADQAKVKMNQVVSKVLSAVKGLGVNEKDVKTENINVYQNYDSRPVLMIEPAIAPAKPIEDPNSKATSYNATTNLVITLTNVELANQIIDVATQNGANQIGGVEFDNTDKTVAENEARQKAVDDAKKKAEMAAKTAGFSLGKLINYQENSGGFGPKLYAAEAAVDTRNSASTQLQPGENEVVLSVTLFYEVK